LLNGQWRSIVAPVFGAINPAPELCHAWREDLVHEYRSLAIEIGLPGAVGHQSSRIDEIPDPREWWQKMLERYRDTASSRRSPPRKPVSNPFGDIWADTTTSHGRLMLTVLGGLAEFERDLIRARTGEGRERAKARGVKMGRKPKLTPHQQAEAIKRRDAGEPMRDIGKSFNVSHSTISRLTS
jgi:hypothetical protein